MLNRDRHFIYMAIYCKYDNNILPQIPRVLVSYLLDNPGKIDFYLNKNIHVGMLLERLCKVFKEKEEINILEEIVQYVEVELCKTILRP